MSTEDAALGIYRIANANMAQAIRTLTVQRGIDPRDFALVSFGGAGGQHAVEVAREMQVPTVIFPPHPSTFSALGLLTADVQMTRAAPVVGLLREVDPALAARRFAELEERVLKVLGPVSAGGRRPEFTRFANLRYRGQVHSIRTAVRRWEEPALVEEFENSHFVSYGTRLGDPVEVVNVGVTGRLALERPRLAAGAHTGGRLEILRKARVLIEGREIPVVARASIAAGARVPTPCLVEEEDSVIYLPTGVSTVADAYGNLVCEVGAQARRRR
jgi:N-methylhydantoinase A